MFGTRSLALEWSRTGVACGLLRAIATVPEPGTHALVVSVDGEPVWRGAAEPEADGRLRINLHTHLIADGRREIRIALRPADGRACEAAAGFDIRNHGALADAVRDALRRHDVPLVFLGDCDASYYAEAQRQMTSWIDAPDAEARIAGMLAEGAISEGEAGVEHR